MRDEVRDEVRDKITQATYTGAFVLSDVRDGPISKTVNPNQETSSVANRFLRKLCSKQSGSLLGAKQEFARSKVGAVQLRDRNRLEHILQAIETLQKFPGAILQACAIS